MGKLAVYKYFAFMFLIISVLMAGFTFFGLFGGHSNPAGGSTASALLVYALPLLILGNAVLLVYWLVRRRWLWSLIPVVTLLCCIPYIGTIYQPGFLHQEANGSKPGLKVATYNVALFGRETTGFKAEDILAEMKKEAVDVLCLQEYTDHSGEKPVSERYHDYFPYHEYGKPDMIIYSRYPIREHGIVDIVTHDKNSAMYADVEVNKHVVRVVSVHLETTGLNRTMHQAAKKEMQGLPVEKNPVLRAIYGNYTQGMVVRAKQAKTVNEFIEASPHPVVLCGDFNDVPYSYVYRTAKGKLKDGFTEAGQGFMRTFREGKKQVRIDYIFHDKSLSAQSYYFKKITYSDHYPVVSRLAFE